MLNWSWKQWISQPGRSLLVMVVFAGVLSLAMLFDGIRIGIIEDIRDFPSSLNADLVAVNSGNIYFAMGPSALPRDVLSNVRSVADVATADPIGLIPFILSANAKRTPAMIVAYGASGGPKNIVAGRAPGSAPEIVLDSNLARLHSLNLGDKVEILGTEMSIVGLSSGTTSPFTPFTFVAYDQFVRAAIRMVMSGEIKPDPGGSMNSMLLIKVKDDVDIDKARAELEAAAPGADFFTPAEVGNADAALGQRLMGSVLFLLSAMTWLITLLTMAVLRQAEVQSNLHQFGVQKALGARPAGLALALTFGGVLIALSAFPLALVMAQGLASIMSDWNPLYGARVWDPTVLSRALIVSLTAAIFGSLLPLRGLIKLDPVIVFAR